MEPVPERAVCAVRWPLGQASGMIPAASRPTGTALMLSCLDSGSGDQAEAPPSPADDPCHRWAVSCLQFQVGGDDPQAPHPRLCPTPGQSPYLPHCPRGPRPRCLSRSAPPLADLMAGPVSAARALLTLPLLFFLRIQISCGFVCGTQCEDKGSGQGKSCCLWRPPSGPHAIGGRAREPQAKPLEDLLVTGSEAPSPRPPSRGGQWEGQGTLFRPDTRPWGLSSPQASLSGSCPRGSPHGTPAALPGSRWGAGMRRGRSQVCSDVCKVRGCPGHVSAGLQSWLRSMSAKGLRGRTTPPPLTSRAPGASVCSGR